MLDPTTISALATSTVSLVLPLLLRALDKGAEEVGRSAAGVLLEKLKQRLGHAGAKDVLEHLSKQPQDSDSQAALRVHLKIALESDPQLVGHLQEWVAETKRVLPDKGVTQTANFTGDNNKVIQINGSENQVS